MATGSIYIKKPALHKLEGVEAYVASCLTGQAYLGTVAPAQWRDKREQLYMPMEHAAYLPKPEYKRQQKDLPSALRRAMMIR